jgi:hypothetical protein
VTFNSTATSGSPGALVLTTQPSSTATSGTPFARQPHVQVRDALGNDVRQAGLAVHAGLASGSGATLTGQLTAGTDANGLASFSDLMLSGSAGSFTIGFTTTGLTPAISDPIALGGGEPSGKRSTVAAKPTSIAVHSGTSTITVTVLDAKGTSLAGVTVIPATDGAGAFVPASAATNTQGVATFTFSSPAAGSETISATAGTVAIEQTVVVTVAKVLTTTTLTSSPNPSLFGQEATFTATVTAPSAAPSGTVRFVEGTSQGVSCSSGSVLGSGAVSEATGQVTFSTSALFVGSHYIRACYDDAGGTFAASQSSTLRHRVRFTD